MLLGDSAVIAILPATDLNRARRFWTGLGLKEVASEEELHEVTFEAGDRTYFAVYERSEPTRAEHTVLGFDVPDLDATMMELRDHGVTFEEYDMAYLKTEQGVAQMGDARGAWFKDSEGNIISVGEGMRGRMRRMASSGMRMGGDMGM